eukprot:scaffold208149_cov33-Tisochrysis_lutea.AAC.2
MTVRLLRTVRDHEDLSRRRRAPNIRPPIMQGQESEPSESAAMCCEAGRRGLAGVTTLARHRPRLRAGRIPSVPRDRLQAQLFRRVELAKG